MGTRESDRVCEMFNEAIQIYIFLLHHWGGNVKRFDNLLLHWGGHPVGVSLICSTDLRNVICWFLLVRGFGDSNIRRT